MAGEGEPGRNGAPNGDLHVIVKVKSHPLFRREGDVIVCEVPIGSALATLGGVIEVPTLDGTVEMKIPAGTQSGAVFRLRGKGGALGGGRGARGDLHIRVTLEVPSSLDDKQRQLVLKLDEALAPAQYPETARFSARLRDLRPKKP